MNQEFYDYWNQEISKALNLLNEQSLKHKFFQLPAAYVTNEGVIDGLGFVLWVLKVKEDWFIVFTSFMSRDGTPFGKLLLMKWNNSATFGNCHSYYIDEQDLDKGGGTNQKYFDNADIIAPLIFHALHYDETNCEFCRGEGKYQTHFINLLDVGVPDFNELLSIEPVL